MTNHKIVFLDIDGTILRSDDSIEPATKEAIKKVQYKGVEVFLATGRPLHEIRDIGKDLQIESFIGYNGAYAIHKEKELYVAKMKKDMVKTLLHTAEKHGHEAVLYTKEKNVLTSFSSPVLTEFTKHFHLKENVLCSDEYLADVLGMTLVNVQNDPPSLYEKTGEFRLASVNVEGFRNHAYDVIRNQVNKGIAVETVLEALRIDKRDAVAFGDGMNDREMLSTVGDGVAMANAQPELFPYAKHKTTSVNDSGVYNGLKNLGLIT
ncbi:HAD family hydrolase [Halalkalibacter wakoensis]|nr:HAD family hydrolase [Halalkalibacter wakoensis]